MRSRTSQYLVALLIAFSGISSANAMVFSISGTASMDGSSFDQLGLFGGGTLNGAAFTLSVSLDPNQYSSISSSTYSNGGSGTNTAPYTFTATVNGITQSGTSDPNAFNFGNIGLENYLTKTGNLYDNVLVLAQGFIGSAYISMNAYITSFVNPMGLDSLDFEQTYSYAPQPGDFGSASLYISAFGLTTQIYGTNYFTLANGATFSDVSLNPTIVAPVPEPGSLALLGIGIAGLASCSRKRI